MGSCIPPSPDKIPLMNQKFVLSALVCAAVSVCADVLRVNDADTCKDLCGRCQGTASFVDDRCECYIDDKNIQGEDCLKNIKKEADDLGLNFMGYDPAAEDASAREARRCGTGLRSAGIKANIDRVVDCLHSGCTGFGGPAAKVDLQASAAPTARHAGTMGYFGYQSPELVGAASPQLSYSLRSSAPSVLNRPYAYLRSAAPQATYSVSPALRYSQPGVTWGVQSSPMLALAAPSLNAHFQPLMSHHQPDMVAAAQVKYETPAEMTRRRPLTLVSAAQSQAPALQFPGDCLKALLAIQQYLNNIHQLYPAWFPWGCNPGVQQPEFAVSLEPGVTSGQTSEAIVGAVHQSPQVSLGGSLYHQGPIVGAAQYHQAPIMAAAQYHQAPIVGAAQYPQGSLVVSGQRGPQASLMVSGQRGPQASFTVSGRGPQASLSVSGQSPMPIVGSAQLRAPRMSDAASLLQTSEDAEGGDKSLQMMETEAMENAEVTERTRRDAKANNGRNRKRELRKTTEKSTSDE